MAPLNLKSDELTQVIICLKDFKIYNT